MINGPDGMEAVVSAATSALNTVSLSETVAAVSVSATDDDAHAVCNSNASVKKRARQAGSLVTLSAPVIRTWQRTGCKGCKDYMGCKLHTGCRDCMGCKLHTGCKGCKLHMGCRDCMGCKLHTGCMDCKGCKLHTDCRGCMGCRLSERRKGCRLRQKH